LFSVPLTHTLKKISTVIQNASEVTQTSGSFNTYQIVQSKTENELKVTFDRLTFHIENSPLAFIEWDNRGYAKTWSKRAEEIFGWSATEFINGRKKGINQVYEEDVPLMTKILSDLTSGTVQRNNAEHRIVTKDGRTIWCEWFNSIILDENGKVVTIMSLVQDITERKKAEEQKEFLQKEKEALINTTEDLIWSIDKNFNLIAGNKAFLKRIEDLTGIKMKPGDQLMKKEFFTDEILLYWDHVYTRALSGTAFKDEIFYPAQNNSSNSWGETSFNPIFQDGTLVGIACYSRDITERKLNEDRIRQSEAHLAEAQRLARLGSWDYNMKNDRLTWSEELYHVFGTDKQTFLETHGSFLDLIDAEDREFALQASRHTQLTGEPFTIEYHVTTPGGERKVIREHGYAETDSHGKIIRLFGTTQDITERKQAEDAVRRSEDRIRLMIDTIPIMAWTVQPDGFVNFFNKRWLDYAGESASKNPNSIIHPEDFPGAMERWRTQMVTEEFSEDELRLRRADGEYRWFLVRVAPLHDEHGVIVHWYGVSIDIEERKHAQALLYNKEQEFRTIVENAPDHIARYDRQFRRTYANPSLARLFNLSMEDVIDIPMFSLPRNAGLKVDEDVLTDIRQRYEEVFQTGQSCEFEVTVPMPGGLKDFNVRVFPEFDLNGSVNNVLSISRDITESKKAEDDLNLMNEKLRSLSAHLQNIQENERTAIAREIHDELGQNLTALKMDIDWLSKRLPDDAVLKEKVKDILAMVGDIFKTVKRIAVELRPNILDDLGLIAALEWQGQEFEKHTGITFQFNCDCLTFNPDRNLSTHLFRITQEALTNVARHSEATKIEITLEATDHFARLIIEDNGKGFDIAEVKEKNSLGLIGMNERALMLKGKLTIESIEAQGTVITLVVPIPEETKKEI